MTENLSSQIPSQCVDICEFKPESVNWHGIKLTADCPGPVVGQEGDEYTSRTSFEAGEVVVIQDVVASTAGRVICRNAGALAWLNKRQEVYREGK